MKAGDLGGFVESEINLSAGSDTSWIFDDAIAAGNAFVDQDSCLFGRAIVCGIAYVSKGASLSAEARVEDAAYIRGATVCGHARVSANSMVMDSPDTGQSPFLSEFCTVYGTVVGDVHVLGKSVILGEERIVNNTLDTLIINGPDRSVLRNPSRDELAPQAPQPGGQNKSKRKKDVAR